MKIHILAVGNKMPAWVDEGFNEYVRRMPRETDVRLMEIKPEKRAGKDRDKLLSIESERIQAALPTGCHVVVMDERGQQASTLQLAQMLTDWLASGRNTVFIIGGADGLHSAIQQLAHQKLALSALTLPHGLARVLLAEQLYRATTVNRQHPYHRA
ncbi:MAG: 23S rRNA (pseudouridine(1915)-N(3))-methyltransferase RlmH [Nitrosomonas sp.]|nr:23S rRNA (pseudouridine(1915)-N(3))-methyltransferase RlmH [Nitrosomonas sp.]